MRSVMKRQEDKGFKGNMVKRTVEARTPVRLNSEGLKGIYGAAECGQSVFKLRHVVARWPGGRRSPEAAGLWIMKQGLEDELGCWVYDCVTVGYGIASSEEGKVGVRVDRGQGVSSGSAVMTAMASKRSTICRTVVRESRALESASNLESKDERVKG